MDKFRTESKIPFEFSLKTHFILSFSEKLMNLSSSFTFCRWWTDFIDFIRQFGTIANWTGILSIGYGLWVSHFYHLRCFVWNMKPVIQPSNEWNNNNNCQHHILILFALATLKFMLRTPATRTRIYFLLLLCARPCFHHYCAIERWSTDASELEQSTNDTLIPLLLRMDLSFQCFSSSLFLFLPSRILENCRARFSDSFWSKKKKIIVSSSFSWSRHMKKHSDRLATHQR